MPVSGLILTLSTDKDVVIKLLEWMDADDCVEIGQRVGNRLAIVLDTTSKDADKLYWERLQNDDGVVFVDVSCVYFDEDEGVDVQEFKKNASCDVVDNH